MCTLVCARACVRASLCVWLGSISISDYSTILSPENPTVCKET